MRVTQKDILYVVTIHKKILRLIVIDILKHRIDRQEHSIEIDTMTDRYKDRQQQWIDMSGCHEGDHDQVRLQSPISATHTSQKTVDEIGNFLSCQ